MGVEWYHSVLQMKEILGTLFLADHFPCLCGLRWPNRAGAPGYQNNNNINNTLFGLQQMGTDDLGASDGGGFGFELGRASDLVSVL